MGERFPCVLPGHDGASPDANLWRDRNRGVWIYRDHHQATEGRKAYALAEIYAAAVSGRVARRGRSELARWKLRALAELGFVDLPRVDLPPLRPGASPEAAAAREGVELLFAVRRIADPGDAAAPISRRFLADWCGMWPDEAERAKRELIAGAVIEKDGVTSCRFGPMSTWRPGRTSPVSLID